MLLLISNHALRARTLAVHLAANGQYPLLAFPENALFLCEQKDIGGVVLDLVDGTGASEALLRTIRSRYPELPVAVIVPDATPESEMGECIPDADLCSVVSPRVQYFYASQCGFSAHPLSTYTLSVDLCKGACYKGYPLPLTPTELRLLHLLLYRAPRPTSADDLHELCASKRSAKVAGIAVHVHHINQKASALDPRPLILHQKDGYRLRDGIL